MSRAVGAAAAVLTALITVLVVAPVTAGAATASTEEITLPGSLTPLSTGGSDTSYGVILPSGASCPGDTAHDGYHVFSYLVPKGVSPTSVSFKTGEMSKYYGFISYGAYYGAINTAENTGQIIGIPSAFTWSRLTPKDLFPDGQKSAVWDGGIACADVHGNVTDYWNSEITFTASSSDPGGFTWKVVHQSAVSSTSTGLTVGLILIAVAVVFAAVAVVLSLRARKSGPPEVESDIADPEPRPDPQSDPDPEVQHAGR